jgi:3-oxoacyl-[acyl-carrier protein] reductase
MQISLTGRSALITGGSKGIELGIATRFAQSGAEVAIVAHEHAALDYAAGLVDAAGPGRVVAVAADVSKAAGVERAYDEVMRWLGKIDIVVNNAGTSRAGAFEARI